MPTILITGGTGLIGNALTAALLEKNYKVIVLTRHLPTRKNENTSIVYAVWDISTQTIDEKAISQADHIIHLAGAGIADKRWNKKRKQEIADSRVKGGELIVKALKNIPNSVKTVVSASAIGWYGEDPVIPNPHPFTEDAPADNTFLGETCLRWEQSTEPLAGTSTRLVKLRTGIVLSKEGGALKEFIRPLRYGFATILGTGTQVISWIHIEDLVRLYISAIENEKMHGVYNAVAPSPVSNKKLVLQLARQRKGQFFIPVVVPAFVLKMALGEMSVEVLKSATVSCDKVHRAGFTFLYPSIEAALANLK